MSRESPPDEEPADADVPTWDDEYLDRVADQLKFNFDLQRDKRVDGELFPMYGELRIQSHKQFFHPALNYAHQSTFEHLFVRQVDRATVAELERSVALGEELADRWVEADEEHRSTEFTFVFVAPEISADVRSFVEQFRERTLIAYGYKGHYEINIVVVAPDREDHVASTNADVWRAFTVWTSPEEQTEQGGLLSRLARRLRR